MLVLYLHICPLMVMYERDRWHWIPWDWSYSRSGATMCVLGTESSSSGRSASARPLSHLSGLYFSFRERQLLLFDVALRSFFSLENYQGAKHLQ